MSIILFTLIAEESLSSLAHFYNGAKVSENIFDLKITANIHLSIHERLCGDQNHFPLISFLILTIKIQRNLESLRMSSLGNYSIRYFMEL